MRRAEPGALKEAAAARDAWFAGRGWEVFAFQRACWEAFAAGRSGLLEVPTGAGKTYAAFWGPLAEMMAVPREGRTAAGVEVLYLTPLRAVGNDIARALRAPIEDLGLSFEVGVRTGDTAAAAKQRQRSRPPAVLVTTPESLGLWLTHPGAAAKLAGLRALILDEWHELMGSKRGALLELSLAQLRRLAPGMRTWALSATLGNVVEAARCAVGVEVEPLVLGQELARPVEIETVLPETLDAFPWAGHLGLRLLPEVCRHLDDGLPTLLFTNTRNQAESWYRELLAARPEWQERIGLHHGSLDFAERQRVEVGLKEGRLRLAIATSSLDLGVDFSPIERVVQVGSPKGIARLLQRAGRSAHRPQAPCRLLFVPTHALEVVEIAAAREALAARDFETRPPLRHPHDCLVQHLVSRALGGGFVPDELYAEIATAHSWRELERGDFNWVLDLVHGGGRCLEAYPEYCKLQREGPRYTVRDPRVARLHRMNLGTITSDTSLGVTLGRGGALGSVEESFLSRLKPGQTFWFAGRCLELVSLDGVRARVRLARGKESTVTPQWMGGRMPLSSELAHSVRACLDRAARGEGTASREMAAVAPILAEQARLSRVPGRGELLAEVTVTAEGHHLLLYPFEGRLVHEGLVVLLARRLSRRRSGTFSLSVNDYGLHLLSPEPYPFEELWTPDVLSPQALEHDIEEAVALGEMSRRHFREVAEVAGLIFPNRPGRGQPLRQLQASATLLWEVFQRFDPRNLLLAQARREVLERHFERPRLERALTRMRAARWCLHRTRRPTPLAFPLLVEQIRQRVGEESLAERVERLRRACLKVDSASKSQARP